MDELMLVKPSMEYEADILALRRELLEEGAHFDGCSGLQKFDRVEDWLENNQLYASDETCPAGKVPSDCYLAVRKSDNRIVGVIDLRHHIDNPVLSLWGGHIGYSVRPSERRKGYAKEMLRLNLLNCKALGIGRVMITCHPENTASEKTIRANGGVFEKEVVVDGEIIRRFWIDLT